MRFIAICFLLTCAISTSAQAQSTTRRAVQAAERRGDRIEQCAAAVYATPSDRANRKHRTAYGVDPTTRAGIAHRTLPLGSFVTVCNIRADKCAQLQVIDRGPFGKLDEQGKWFNGARDTERAGEWRGCIDLTPKAARAISVHPGDGRAQVQLITPRSLRGQLNYTSEGDLTIKQASPTSSANITADDYINGIISPSQDPEGIPRGTAGERWQGNIIQAREPLPAPSPVPANQKDIEPGP